MSTLGRPTRDINGFWQYAVWNERDGTITEHPSYAHAKSEAFGQDQEILIRRWMGGWQAVEDE